MNEGIVGLLHCRHATINRRVEMPPTFISLSEAFSERAILRSLCKERLSYSKRAHLLQYMFRLARNTDTLKKADKLKTEILAYMPPRSRWKRPNQVHRKAAKPSAIQMLEHTVRVLRNSALEEDKKWISKQNELIQAIKDKILNQNSGFKFSPPHVFGVPKESAKDSQKKEYRILAAYSNLEDKLIASIFAKYLRDAFDQNFHPSSCAFRSPLNYLNPLSHSDAFKKIIKFWKDNVLDSSRRVWVSECDIQGFYDTIGHSVVLDVYEAAVKKMAPQHTNELLGHAKQLLRSYLRSYNYPKARAKILKHLRQPLTSECVRNRNISLRQFYKCICVARYGVPQGGAISCFLANLVLDYADWRVDSILKTLPGPSLYLRYCDDIIILSCDKETATKAINEYSESLIALKLPQHAFESQSYGRKFWDGKSKQAYEWAYDAARKAEIVPWLSFVGYQLRPDGQIRVRKKSIIKESQKQRRVVDEILKHVKPRKGSAKVHWHWKKIYSSIVHRLQAMSIGRPPIWDLDGKIREECWCDGFACGGDPDLPPHQPILQTQLRRLDNSRRKQLRRAKNQLFQLEGMDAGTNEISPSWERGLKFHGKPRSYSGQFSKQRAD